MIPELKTSTFSKIPRRTAVKWIAAALMATTGTLGILKFRQTLQSEAPADIFKNDAPGPDVWDAWTKRGWTKEAMHYIKVGKNVQCKLCPNNCILAPGDRSHCRNKVNIDGTLFTMVFGNPCAFHIDPVEKKPLYHFLPGTPTFSISTSGCVFRCLNCQNWEISQKKPEETKNPNGPELKLRPPIPETLTIADISKASMFPDDVVAIAKYYNCPSISFTYGEPVSFYEYTIETAKLARKEGLKNIIVSSGSIEERPLRELAQYIDAAHIDLKGFDDWTYRKLNSGKLGPVLRTIKILHEVGVWVEIINLIVPTFTDNLENIKRMCYWLCQNIGPYVPIHFSRFHPQHKLLYLPPTSSDTLVKARELAISAGIKFVYMGNAPELNDAGQTKCPNCHKVIIDRSMFSVTLFELKNGKCPYCSETIPGIWV